MASAFHGTFLFQYKIACTPELSYFLSVSQLYAVVVCCSMAAAVQGMDESVTNGANLFWAPQLVLPPCLGKFCSSIDSELLVFQVWSADRGG